MSCETYCYFGDLAACLHCRCQMARRIQGGYGCNRHSAGASRHISYGAFDLAPTCQHTVTDVLFVGLTLQTPGFGTKFGGR